MDEDKFKAIWLSHSSISDYINCPRAYYLKNIYKDPKTNRKVQVVSPALSLGSAIHQVIESLSVLPVKERFKISLIDKFNQIWPKFSGSLGGFSDLASENKSKQRGLAMLDMLARHPGPLGRPAVKIREDLPNFWLSQKDQIILCGKIDWLEYLSANDSVHIIDFKTSHKEEPNDSLQLPIYHLLVLNCQPRRVYKASYWYLEKGPKLIEKTLPDPEKSINYILKIAKKIKLSRQLNHFKCPKGDKGCFHCQPFESILNGQAQYVGVGDFRDNYMVTRHQDEPQNQSIVL